MARPMWTRVRDSRAWVRPRAARELLRPAAHRRSAFIASQPHFHPVAISALQDAPATSKEDGMELIELSIVLTLVLVVGHLVETVTD